MKLEKVLFAILVVLLVGGLAAAPVAEARGGKGKGKGGKRKKDGRELDRKGLVEEMEKDGRAADRIDRVAGGRRADFESVHRENREKALADLRRTGEDARRAQDARFEAPR